VTATIGPVMTTLLLFFLSVIFSGHPVHISFTSVEIDFTAQEAALTYKFNTDDFSLLFFHVYEKTIRPEMNQELTPIQLKLIDTYLYTSFVMTLDSDTLDFKFVGKEQNEEFIWLHYKCHIPKASYNSLQMTNTLLLELNQDQSNLVILTYGGQEAGNTFNISNRKWNIPIRQD
jgi:hypothetical protein